jgi:protein-S-isoprenylcysteine O-methyltransferase Ste14
MGNTMRMLPTLTLRLDNQWLLLAVYLLFFLYFVFRLPKDRRTWLFADPKEAIHRPKKLVLRIGQLLAFGFIVLVCLTPLPTLPSGPAIIGLILYVTGMLLVLLSLHFFGQAPSNQPVLAGPYRFSRNPQWVGLFLVLFGLALSAQSWLLVLMVILVGGTYHIQILAEEELCRAQYGATYERYLRTVPRYLLF